MRIADKLKFVLPVLSIILLALSYNQFISGYDFSKQVVKISKPDIDLMKELSGIKGNIKLKSIKENMLELKILLNSLFSSTTIINSDNDEEGGIDRIGEFRDITIKVDGDFFKQVYFLQQIKENMHSFVVINKMLGSNNQAIIDVRIYGKTINE